MRNFHIVAFVVILMLTPFKTAQAMDVISKYVPHAVHVGEARMRVMMWDVYDAKLYASQGQWREDQPFALELTYLRPLVGQKIADRAVQEMREQNFDNEVKLATWHTQMRDIFPNVDAGDSLTGVNTKEGYTIFFKGNEEIGRIDDTLFSKHFFAIWLSPKTSAPDVRLGLLGRETMKGYNHYEKIEGAHSNGISSVY